MPTKDYRAEGIVVHWDSDRCIHSAHCVRTLPAVFDTSARPWVDLTGAPADAVAVAVDGCPSRALTYTRTDGGAEGAGARRADDDTAPEGHAAVTVRVRDDGPLVVTGGCAVVAADGTPLGSGDPLFLCRCGGSDRKPFCDGTHKRNGFSG